jgi:23S rRNA pseudouridine1911/1915/1917 synthase
MHDSMIPNELEEIENISELCIISPRSERLDKFLTGIWFPYSRAQIQRAIDQGHVIRVDQGQERALTQPASKVSHPMELRLVPLPPSHCELIATPMTIHVVYEDEWLLVVNKPAGLTVHPGAGNYQDTLVNGLLYRQGGREGLSQEGGFDRPGIVHRLDKDTSGLMVVAKDDYTHRLLSEQLSKREISRHYHAWVWGQYQPKKGTISSFMGRHPKERTKMAVLPHEGKWAVTHYETLTSWFDGAISHVRYVLETGRTHQIRVHSAHQGHPLLGDHLYGGALNTARKKNIPTIIIEHLNQLATIRSQLLHAYYLRFYHPHLGQWQEYNAPYSQELDDFHQLLHTLTVI